MTIAHIGQSHISTPERDLLLKDVLHVPEADKSLISASRLSIDNNTFVEIHPHSFFVKDRGSKRVLLQGRGRRGLYPFKHMEQGAKKHVLNATPSSDRWHRCLGHPSPLIVSKIISKNNLPCANSFNKDYVCDACQKGKSHQLPYPKSISESKFPLELVFFDVWGPAEKAILCDFIDDFSKFTWIYLIKQKFEVFQKFHDFQKLVERQFDRKILALQTDWGGEYEKLNSFFRDIGIEHHVSCPHAHQQNGSAERKHRHIVEGGLSVLAHDAMPLKYWDEAFIAATYLINRLPSKVIGNITPLEKLFHQKPDYNTLKIFGCACYPNLRPYSRHKLDF